MSAAVRLRSVDPLKAAAFTPAELAARDKVLRLHGRALLADPSGALYWPEERLLIVADLHLEKGSAYAARRVFLPPYDTAGTLARLAAVVARLAPRRIVALGDSFHDGDGAARIRAHDLQALRAMQIGREWLWIAGNHDPDPPFGLGGDHAEELVVSGIGFRHEPSRRSGTRNHGNAMTSGEIVGHLHPVAVVGGRGGAVRRRCFLTDDAHCILPAFGAYAGGLNILDPAFGRFVSEATCEVHALGRNAVYSVARNRCLEDRASAALSWRA